MWINVLKQVDIFAPEYCPMGLVIVGILFIVFIIYISVRKIEITTLPPMDLEFAFQETLYLMRKHRWETVPHLKKYKLKVDKSSMVATDIYLKQNPDGTINVLSGVNAGDTGWAIVIFTFQLIGGIFLMIYLHVKSRQFAKDALVSHSWPSQKRRRPFYRENYKTGLRIY